MRDHAEFMATVDWNDARWDTEIARVENEHEVEAAKPKGSLLDRFFGGRGGRS